MHVQDLGAEKVPDTFAGTFSGNSCDTFSAEEICVAPILVAVAEEMCVAPILAGL